jgi:nucleoside-diphosphate-sugar epimerase
MVASVKPKESFAGSVEALRVVVTGANGFLGSHIVRTLCRQHLRVVALVRPNAELRFLEHTRARVERVDFQDIDALKRVMTGADVVVHNAALATDWAPRHAFDEANVKTVSRVIRAAVDVGVRRFVHISSNAVLGEEDSLDAKSEHSPYRPRLNYALEALLPSAMNVYRETKAEGEILALSLARAHQLQLTVLRPVWIYGPREFHAGPYEYCKTILSRVPWFPGSRTNRFHVVYVGDVANAVLTVIERQRPGITIYQVGPETPPLQYEYFGTFARCLDVRQPKPVPKWLLLPLAVMLEFLCVLLRSAKPPLLTRARLEMFYANNIYDTHSLSVDLGFRAETPLSVGVARTVRWWQMFGYLPKRKG